jgi:hypothetical protein
MGNLRQSMTEEEWNELGIPKDSLLRIINTDNDTDIISQMLDNLPKEKLDTFCDKIPDKNGIPDKNVSHPKHYGGKDNPYETIKVIDAWGLDFCLGNVIKYVSRAGKKNESALEDLEKANWYICHAIKKLKGDAG